MAKIFFEKTNDGLIKGLVVGAMIGTMLGVIIFGGRYNFDLLSILLCSIAGAVIGGTMFALLYHSYESSCSDCGADLTTFCSHPDGKLFIHCPACGAKFTDSE